MLDPARFPIDLGWRLGFGLGAALGLMIIFFRKHVPESPRWLLTHGQPEEAERIVAEIERQIEEDPAVGTLPAADHGLTIQPPRGRSASRELAGVMLRKYPGRTVLGLALIDLAGVPLQRRLLHLPADAAQVLRGRARTASGSTCCRSRSAIPGPAAAGPALRHGRPQADDRRRPTPSRRSCWRHRAICSPRGSSRPPPRRSLWAVIFFFASAAASSAYLTVSEIFPLELRGHGDRPVLRRPARASAAWPPGCSAPDRPAKSRG